MDSERPDARPCPLCDSATKTRLDPHLHYCPNCGYWFSSFSENPHALTSTSELNEPTRMHAIRVLRLENAAEILALLGRLRDLRGKSVLDVGCAYGWFLELAQKQGLRCTGIEPEAAIAQEAQRSGLPVRVGYFPNCLGDEERFDLIVFNDVFEHLPEVAKMMSVCHAHLGSGGLLVINSPSSSGIFFRLSLLLARFGMRAPLDRLWQRHFHSPHLSYFNDRNLALLAGKFGFRLVLSKSLRVLKVRGLWARLRMDKRSSLPYSLLLYGGLLLGYPLLAVLPSDILLHVYEKND